MANRPYFMATKELPFYKEENCEFEFFTGFAITQKRKSITSLHKAIQKKWATAKILEVSRKSANPIGNQLSAFNLVLKSHRDKRSYPVENIFQSSKVFSNGGPYKELLYCSPIEAKKDPRLKESGNLLKFQFEGKDWEIVPTTSFYDFIYIRALWQNQNLIKQILDYDTFTDIEFNPKKSFNCQARSVAIFVSLYKMNLIDKYMSDIEVFKQIYSKPKSIVQSQLSFNEVE